jgi:hypothetical protein
LYISIRPSDRHTVCVGSLDGPVSRELFASYSAAQYARGYLITNEEGRLMARSFDPRALSVRGDPQLVVAGAEQDNIGHDNFTCDPGGTLVFQPVARRPTRLVWQGRDAALEPAPWGAIPEPASWALSHDARRLVYATRNPRDIWVYDRDATAPSRLTFEDHNVGGITLSRDGRLVAVGRQLGFGAFELRVKPLDGSGPETPLFRGPGLFTLPTDWSPDGRWIVTVVSDSTGSFDFWLVPSGGDGEPRVFERTASDEYSAAVSPDGRWLAYGTLERGQVAVYIVSFPVPDVRHQLLLPGPVYPAIAWSTSGRELLVGDRSNRILAVEVQTEPVFRQGTARTLFVLPPNSLPLGLTPGEDRMLLALSDPSATRAGLEVMLGWPRVIEAGR